MNASADARVNQQRRRFERWLRLRRVHVSLAWDIEKGEYLDLDEQWLWLAFYEGACPDFNRRAPAILQSISKPPLKVTP